MIVERERSWGVLGSLGETYFRGISNAYVREWVISHE